MSFDRYGSDVLYNADWKAPRRGHAQPHPADRGLVVEEVVTGCCGEIVRVDRDLRTLELEDRRGKRRTFPLGPGFLLEGRPVILHAPVRTGPAAPTRTASGSVAVATDARVARAGRIYVEGRHDAELVERVWGDDLRVEGVVVEYLDGIDDLSRVVAEFAPAPGRRLGVLADHLVRGSKESRIAAAVMKGPHRTHTLVVGHPYVDIWQAVKPARLGLDAWPSIPRGMDWKTGICTTLGWPSRTQADIARAWQPILGTVRSYADLEPALLGRVEELIDFVTTG
ncbi:MAG: DUF3097 domain-containing protein [Actinomycetota bacterium]|nr:DUF3097 domain-containing protein [Actinomycetota bacterium]